LSAALALIISDKYPTKILLTQRKQPDRPLKHGRWHLPGGAIEHSETAFGAVQRELFEELGWTDSKVLNEVMIRQENNEFSSQISLFHIFLIQASIAKKIDISKDTESSKAGWIELR